MILATITTHVDFINNTVLNTAIIFFVATTVIALIKYVKRVVL